MCACVPALKPVVSAVFPRLLSATSRATPSNPFAYGHSHSTAYYQRNDSNVELSHDRRPHNDASEESLSFDTATRERGIHVKQEWSVSDKDFVHAM